MSSEITEIIEVVKTKLDIIEGSWGRLEVIDNGAAIIEVVETTTDSDLNIKSQTVIIELSPDSNTNIDISEGTSTTVDISETQSTVEIYEKSLISGSFDLDYNNLLNTPLNRSGNNLGTSGVLSPSFPLQVSGTLFSDIISGSQLIIGGNGTEDALIIRVGDDPNIKLRINPQGVMVLDEFTYTPTAQEGGLLYSGSQFYLGLKCV